MAAILAVAMTVSTSIALLTERIAYRPFRRISGLAPLICAIGVSFFLEQSFRGFFGSEDAVRLLRVISGNSHGAYSHSAISRGARDCVRYRTDIPDCVLKVNPDFPSIIGVLAGQADNENASRFLAKIHRHDYVHDHGKPACPST
jgi:hypothetical protein